MQVTEGQYMLASSIVCQQFLQPQHQLMQNPSKNQLQVPTSPTSRPPLPPSSLPARQDRQGVLPIATPRLNGSRSEHKFVRNRQQPSPEKRVRLRDYLFLASTSSQRNNEKKKTLKNTITEKDSLKMSMNLLKKQKYEISNSDMYKIVRQQIKNEYGTIIKDLQTKLAILEDEQNQQGVNQDLVALYNVRRIITDKILPGIKEIDQVYLRKQAGVLREIIRMADEFKKSAQNRSKSTNKTIREEENEESKKQNSNKVPGNLIESLLFGIKKP